MSIIALASNKVARNASREAAPANQLPSTVTDALAAVAAYVPTEVLTAYTLVLGLVAVGQPLSVGTYLVFLAITPLFVWLVFAVKSKEEGRAYVSWRLWPWWESFAASVAFTVWSAALPQTAFSQFGWYKAGIAAVVLVLTSAVLPLLGSLFTKTRSTP